jgi:hypothetical protein
MNTTTATLQSISAAVRIGSEQSMQHGGCPLSTDSDVVTMPDPVGMREFGADSADRMRRIGAAVLIAAVGRPPPVANKEVGRLRCSCCSEWTTSIGKK